MGVILRVHNEFCFFVVSIYEARVLDALCVNSCLAVAAMVHHSSVRLDIDTGMIDMVCIFVLLFLGLVIDLMWWCADMYVQRWLSFWV